MYKIIQDNKIVDVVKLPRFVRFLSSGHVAITDKASAQGIVGSDNKTIYSFKPIAKNDITVAEIKEISLKELNELQNLLSSGQEVCDDEETFNELKRATIRRLSTICKNKITSGFSVRLSDGETYSFKLTIEDQLNLMSIENQLNAGVKTFIYHSTDGPCKEFSKKDMTKIIDYFKRYTLYHTTYFNVAKQYINSATSMSKVTNFVYGDDVSEATGDNAIKKILKTGGNF